jgi:urea transporter
MIFRKQLGTAAASLSRGPAQIVLQANAVSGLLILAGIFYSSVDAGFGALIGLVSGTAFAFTAKLDKGDITAGLYGYNGALVGLALFSLFEPNIALIILAVAGAAGATYIQQLMNRLRIPAYTMPFVVTTWLLILVRRLLDASALSSASTPPDLHLPLVSPIAKGIGQVMLQQNTITGIVILTALLVSSRPAALFALSGSLTGAGLALLLGASPEAVTTGMYGFNAVLCGIVFAGFTRKSFLWAAAAIVVAILLQFVFDLIRIPPLTFPFVASTWLISYLRKRSQDHKRAH